jgi:hypothetical protein
MPMNQDLRRDRALASMNQPRTLACGSHRTALVTALGIGLVCACTRARASADETPPLSVEPTSTTLAAQPLVPAVGAAQESEDGLAGSENDELRRGYGAVDMRFNSCVTRVDEHLLNGSGCPSGFVIYCPYVPVPSNSDIEVAFEFKPTKRVEVYADIVTRMAAQTLAGLSRQVIEAGDTQKLGYRVHVFNADVQVESRIGLSAEPGTDFEITNLTMTVR